MVTLQKTRLFSVILFPSFFWRKNYLCFYLILLLITGIVTSCSKSNNTPEPPHLKTQLVSELFAALRQENWGVALEKINRIRELSPDDAALSGIEISVKNNLTIQNVQEKLDKGDIDEAIKVINDFTEKNGQTVDFRDAMRELNTLKEIRSLSESVAAEEDSVNLAYAAAKLNKTISHYPDAKDLQSFTDRSASRIQELKKKERLMGLEDLRADIDIEWFKNREIIDTLVAMFEAINPNDDLPLAYRKGLAADWNELNFTEHYLNSNLEYIFFRMILFANQEKQQKDLMSKLAELEANNYRTMLMKGFVLNMLGKIDESMAILSTVKNELSISDSQYNSWFILTSTNIDIYEINPFALCPFFIYISNNVRIVNKTTSQ